MAHSFGVDDTVKKRGSTFQFKISRVGVFGNKYASYENPTEFYPEEDLVLVKKAEKYGGSRRSRKNRRRNKKYSRRR